MATAPNSVKKTAAGCGTGGGFNAKSAENARDLDVNRSKRNNSAFSALLALNWALGSRCDGRDVGCACGVSGRSGQAMLELPIETNHTHPIPDVSYLGPNWYKLWKTTNS